MTKPRYVRLGGLALAVALVALLAAPQAGVAQLPLPLPSPLPSPTTTSSTVSGAATGLRATVLGTTTALASTGNLASVDDARGVSLLSGWIPYVGGAQVLEATAISNVYSWDATDSVTSAASLANLALTVAGSSIRAAFVMAEADAPVGAVGTGWSTVEGLSVNGVPIALTGTIGETISLGAVTIVANQVLSSASGITVNALRITSLDGLVDVVVASATAGTQ